MKQELYRVFLFNAKDNTKSEDMARNMSQDEAVAEVIELREGGFPAFHEKQKRRLPELNQ